MKNKYENRYEIIDSMVKLFLDRKLGEEMYTLIDLEDLDRVISYPNKWYISNTRNGKSLRVYAHCKNGNIALHRFLTSAPNDVVVDHVNHDPLDNRKDNLRFLSNSENLQNRRGAQVNSKSGIRGVSWDSSRKKRKVRIRVHGKVDIGVRVNTLEEAIEVSKKLRAQHMPFSEEDKIV